MRDDDRLLDLPEPEFGSGVIGVCDICGTRQAVIVLEKERFKLCVIDFLNKAWVKTEKKPGVPAPLYTSERVWFDTSASPTGVAPAVVLHPTKIARHPVVLVTPDTFGLTTTLLDAAIRFAREGFEVLLPDVRKTEGVGGASHFAIRFAARVRGGMDVDSKRVARLLHLYTDALEHLRHREMVDPLKAAVFGTSFGASLALALAAQDTKLGAVVLAYPVPVRPRDLAKLVSAPLLSVAGSRDRVAAKAVAQFASLRSSTKGRYELVQVPGARHHFLSRDLSVYDLPRAEESWTRIVAFLKRELMPPPPRPPPPPVKLTVAPPGPAPTTAASFPLPTGARPATSPSSGSAVPVAPAGG
jgi:carboxymethylenebutenolidase